LNAAAFAIRSTYHTTLKATPGQLVFGRDMIFNIKHTANWRAIADRKQKLIDKNNARENAKRLKHTYHIGDKVLMDKDKPNKMECPYEGPYEIREVFSNGTVRIKRKAVLQIVNIRQLHPYQS